MAKRSYSHKTAAAAVKRGHGASGSPPMKGAKGNTASYPSKQGGSPSGTLLNGSSPSPTKWGGSGRAH